MQDNYLPNQRPSRLPLPPIRLAAGREGGRPRVLLSELSPIMARAAMSSLRREGYEVKVLFDGMEALWELYPSGYDAVIVGLDESSSSLALVEGAAELDSPPEVIALTKEDLDLAVRAERLGAVSVVGKGWQKEAVSAALQAALATSMTQR